MTGIGWMIHPIFAYEYSILPIWFIAGFGLIVLAAIFWIMPLTQSGIKRQAASVEQSKGEYSKKRYVSTLRMATHHLSWYGEAGASLSSSPSAIKNGIDGNRHANGFFGIR